MLASLSALAGIEIKDAARRGIRLLSLQLTAIVFAFGALFYALSALRNELALKLSSTLADLSIAGLLLLIAAFIAAFAHYYRMRKPAASKLKTAAAVATPLAISMAKSKLPRFVKIVPIVLLAGLATHWLASSKD